MSYTGFSGCQPGGSCCAKCRGGVGGFEPWRQVGVETDEVYVWRGRVSGIQISSIGDVKAIAVAFGKASKGMNLNIPLFPVLFSVKGIALTPITESMFTLDAALTANAAEVMDAGLITDDAEEIGQSLASGLQSIWPGASVSEAGFHVINDNEPKHPALDFWLSHPTIWDPGLGNGGASTAALDRFEGLYRGRAEQGLNLKPWPRKGVPELNGGSKPVASEFPVVPALILGAIGLWFFAGRNRGARKGAATL